MPTESQIISRLKNRVSIGDRVVLGIGDDAAVIKTEGPGDLIACCDLMVEGVHFRTEWTPPRLLGRKALAANLSDVAAMGGIPKFAMISIALPAKYSSEFVDDLFAGVFELANDSGVTIVGGDTSSSRDSLFIDISLIGECQSGKAVSRRCAMIGDRIYVSGSLGAAAMGLSLLEAGFRIEETQDTTDPRFRAVSKLLAPEPRLALGRALGESGLATAMIDISDGLSTDLWHILNESDVGAKIHASQIPVADCVSVAAGTTAVDPLSLALNGGEEYELLFTVRPDNHQQAAVLAQSAGARITEIGEIVAEKRLSLDRNGVIESVPALGYQHLV